LAKRKRRRNYRLELGEVAIPERPLKGIERGKAIKGIPTRERKEGDGGGIGEQMQDYQVGGKGEGRKISLAIVPCPE